MGGAQMGKYCLLGTNDSLERVLRFFFSLEKTYVIGPRV